MTLIKLMPSLIVFVLVFSLAATKPSKTDETKSIAPVNKPVNKPTVSPWHILVIFALIIICLLIFIFTSSKQQTKPKVPRAEKPILPRPQISEPLLSDLQTQLQPPMPAPDTLAAISSQLIKNMAGASGQLIQKHIQPRIQQCITALHTSRKSNTTPVSVAPVNPVTTHVNLLQSIYAAFHRKPSQPSTRPITVTRDPVQELLRTDAADLADPQVQQQAKMQSPLQNPGMVKRLASFFEKYWKRANPYVLQRHSNPLLAPSDAAEPNSIIGETDETSARIDTEQKIDREQKYEDISEIGQMDPRSTQVAWLYGLTAIPIVYHVSMQMRTFFGI